MQKSFEIIRATRMFLLQLVGELTTEQLNTIPPGYNNNIVWNMAHLIAAQQGVCYLRGGLPMKIDASIFDAYQPGTRPQGPVNDAFIDQIKTLLVTTIDELVADYEKGLFNQNPVWTNRYGVEHATIDDTIQFLLFHEGLHIGYIMAQRKLVMNHS